MKNKLKNIAIIMDGNRRWAKKRNLPIQLGHKKGISVLKKIVKYCSSRNINSLTNFAFSTESGIDCPQ